MRSPDPPAVATWVLEHADVDEGLAGDLAEQYRNGRSPLWYWRQSLFATILFSSGTLVTHKWLAVRAILTGWLAWATLSLVRHQVPAWLAAMDPAAAGAWSAPAVSVLRYTTWIAVGWIVGRLHRPYQAAMVMAYVGFTLMMSLPAVSRVAIEVLGHPTYAPPSMSTVLFAVVSLLAGGLLSAPAARRSTSSSF
jgi:hypothetical protein